MNIGSMSQSFKKMKKVIDDRVKENKPFTDDEIFELNTINGYLDLLKKRVGKALETATSTDLDLG